MKQLRIWLSVGEELTLNIDRWSLQDGMLVIITENKTVHTFNLRFVVHFKEIQTR